MRKVLQNFEGKGTIEWKEVILNLHASRQQCVCLFEACWKLSKHYAGNRSTVNNLISFTIILPFFTAASSNQLDLPKVQILCIPNTFSMDCVAPN